MFVKVFLYLSRLEILPLAACSLPDAAWLLYAPERAVRMRMAIGNQWERPKEVVLL